MLRKGRLEKHLDDCFGSVAIASGMIACLVQEQKKEHAREQRSLRICGAQPSGKNNSSDTGRRCSGATEPAAEFERLMSENSGQAANAGETRQRTAAYITDGHLDAKLDLDGRRHVSRRPRDAMTASLDQFQCLYQGLNQVIP